MKSRKFLKTICYILIPIFVLILCITIPYQIYIQEENVIDETIKNYILRVEYNKDNSNITFDDFCINN